MLTLGIESSCDDTAAAVLKDNNQLLASVISSQDDIHERFGGVVPELASRKHLESIQSIVKTALSYAGKELCDIDLIAVTQGPGLIGSLLVGFSYAKALAYVNNTPIVGVDHMSGHLLSVFLEDNHPPFPYLALIVSGGTTSLFHCRNYTDFSLLGRTRDDAAGEAFDKVAKLLDLGYPGGPAVSKKAQMGDRSKFVFPRAWLEHESTDFSFSGLKTAVLQQYNKLEYKDEQAAADICASFQEAVVDVLVTKTINTALSRGIGTIVIGGGVSANSRLREHMSDKCRQNSLSFYFPRPSFCTDNGAMIALSGYYYFKDTGTTLSYDDDVFSRSALG